MTIKRVQQAADCRGIYFDGEKRWRNNMVGYAYEIFTPSGFCFFQSNTLQGMYNKIVKYPKLKNWIKQHNPGA